MKLSILIPTHDYKCYTLVADLQRQAEAAGVEYEIIVGDDGSRDQVSIIANLRINDLPHCRFVRLQDNVGRAAIKNYLARQARGEWLLFIDSDAEVIGMDYISRLLEAVSADDDIAVIAGGLRHADAIPSPQVSLRYRYEKAADRHRSAKERSQHPYQHMTPFNLCIKRATMLDIGFDEKCMGYGYEDAAFGVALQEKGIKIKHIDNVLQHNGLEANAVFLEKTEVSMHTLYGLGDKMICNSHVGQAMMKLRRWHLVAVVAVIFRILRPLMRRNLLGKKPNLTVFALYKLGYLCHISVCRKP